MARTTRAIPIVFVIVLMAVAPASANVNALSSQLESGGQKERLSAALALGKLGDAKGILPLVKALQNDGDAAVRAAAAVGLSKLVTPATQKSIKGLATKALQQAEANDASGLVKKEAKKALVALGGTTNSGAQNGPASSTGPTSTGGSGCYVNIGPMSSKTGDASVDGKMRPVMAKVATKTMGKSAPSMQTTWAGGAVPTGAQLASKGFAGFYVDGTVNELKVTTSGSDATVSCKISMLLADFPNKSVFGFLNGGAKVQGSTSPSDIALASEDCVTAVVEDLIAKKIVPTIRTKATCP